VRDVPGRKMYYMLRVAGRSGNAVSLRRPLNGLHHIAMADV
jgi:hypothetical protein